MQTVLLAAGRGTRMRPLTDRRPKPLLPVVDRPLLMHIADATIDAGATRLVIVVGPGREQVREAFGEQYRETPVTYVEQGDDEGTAAAVRAATTVLDPGPFAVFNGDIVFERDALGPLYGEGPGVLAVRVSDPRQYGVFQTDTAGERVTGVVEKPADPPSNLANAGGYVFPAIAADYLDEVSESERGEYELTDVLERVCAEFSVRPIVVEQWLDVGRPWELLAANEWKLGDVTDCQQGTVHSRTHQIEPVAIAADATVREGVTIEGPVYIGRGATIGPQVSLRGPVRIGPGAQIGHAAEVVDSVVCADTTIGHGAFVEASVIGRNVELGPGTAVAARRPDGEAVRMTVKGQSTSTERETFGIVTGDGARTGINTSLSPGVVLGTDRRTTPGETLMVDRR